MKVRILDLIALAGIAFWIGLVVGYIFGVVLAGL